MQMYWIFYVFCTFLIHFVWIGIKNIKNENGDINKTQKTTDN